MSTVKEYKCLNCKAGLEFDPPSQKWKCHYCFSEFSKQELDAVSRDEELPDEDVPELDVYHCSSCGAELIADATTSATFCLYCKNPTIIKSRFSGRFKPKSVIPFRITKEQAKEIYSKWIKKCLFAPGMFKQQDEIEKITGIYAPFWLFDCQVDGRIDADATRVRSWVQGKYKYIETEYYSVTREGTAEYERIPVDASKKLDDTLMHKIEPYDYRDLTDFSMPYMSGFFAEKYDVEAIDAESVMKQRVEEYIGQRLKNTISGYSSFSVRSQNTALSDSIQNYSLLPVYLLVSKYKGKEHEFIINGQTGKVVGNTPISFLRQLTFAFSLFAAIWLLIVFGGALLG